MNQASTRRRAAHRPARHEIVVHYDTIAFEIAMPDVPGSIDRGIAVLGIGRSGGTTVRHLMENSTVATDWYIIDTDQRDLREFPESARIAFGERLTNRLGTGRNSRLLATSRS